MAQEGSEMGKIKILFCVSSAIGCCNIFAGAFFCVPPAIKKFFHSPTHCVSETKGRGKNFHPRVPIVYFSPFSLGLLALAIAKCRLGAWLSKRFEDDTQKPFSAKPFEYLPRLYIFEMGEAGREKGKVFGKILAVEDSK